MMKPETSVLVEFLQTASRGTDALATKLHIGVRSPKDERDYADFLTELANVLRVHAYMYEEQQNPSARVLDISDRYPKPPPELVLLGNLLGALGELVHRFTDDFVELSRQPRRPPPPDDPPPITA
ncbi:hypothetical protein VA596_43455 [Amycolatopsis sp., V23-08]|uniref:Uncharacterized protein n=1 Tax=Amycolatopsis heterodermiae TaxID=3110235 RepID=A0ABU5RJH8_9PSEU|nr:hypothetical protein [Amycolatopsis sp., V23-08]MEA5366451.1 hypothetical protein [Amycolatopsis sp., V23-08]